MSKEISLFDAPSNVPAHLQGYQTGVSTSLMAAVGSSFNRIGTKGSRFRQVLKGIEVGVWDENYLDVIFVGIVPTVSRKFYAAAYSQGGDNLPPTCYSVDGVVPAGEVHLKQSDKCGQCPQNIKGSKIGDNGTKGKACAYFRRIAVMLAGDPDGILYQLDVAAMGLFGPSHEKDQRYNLNDYAKALESRKMDAGTVVTRLSFDTDQSVPKLLFKPLRFISAEDVEVINALNKDEIKQYLEVSMATVDISKEAGAVDEPVPEAQAPQRAAPKAAPKAKPAPAVVEVVDEVEEEEEAAAVAVQRPPAPKPAQAKPAPQKPAPVAAQKAAPAPAPKPVKAAAAPVEVSNDSEMDDLLAGLDLS